MANITPQRPQVPGGPSCSDGLRGDSISTGARGAKNLRVRSTNRATTTANDKTDFGLLNILTYNVRTLMQEERLIELENALAEIKWDIIGLSEIRREGEDILERENCILCYKGEKSGTNGVGFLIAKKWKENILEFTGYSDRVAALKFKINDSKTLTLIQAYAPTSSHNDDVVEDFYDVLNKACEENRGAWTFILGDFNAKIGNKQELDNETIIGPHDLGIRNERGARLIQWAILATKWIPQDGRRRRGRPRRRWRDDIETFLQNWQSEAQDRDMWRKRGEAFAQQWDTEQATL
ncbi:craniofacial development protein 2-like [Phthorimaea operculella]|nr:craniofacial development protein 2-like [Phthorimaea operculella]